jgi:RNA polymerase sigma-70 factor (family 1)
MLLRKCTDTELWEAVSLDNAKAFDLLFERYWSMIYGTAFSYLKDEDASSQIVQDIFLNMWQKRKTYSIGCFKNYLRSAARYHVYKQLKARKSTALVYVDNYDSVSAIPQSQNAGDENMRYQELQQAVDYSIRQLPKRCQEIFSLSRTDHLTNDEISKRLGISKRTVENQLTTALHSLRSYLKYTVFLLFFLGSK